jgi:hypothetical protein
MLARQILRASANCTNFRRSAAHNATTVGVNPKPPGELGPLTPGGTDNYRRQLTGILVPNKVTSRRAATSSNWLVVA